MPRNQKKGRGNKSRNKTKKRRKNGASNNASQSSSATKTTANNNHNNNKKNHNSNNGNSHAQAQGQPQNTDETQASLMNGHENHNHNHTHDPERVHEHDHEHDHSHCTHDHGHDHDHDHNHNHGHETANTTNAHANTHANSNSKAHANSNPNPNSNSTAKKNSNSNHRSAGASAEVAAAERDISQMTLEEAMQIRKKPRWKVDPNKKFKFWETQPVPDLKDTIKDHTVNTAIETKIVTDVRQKPFLLPSAFEWCDLELNVETETETHADSNENNSNTNTSATASASASSSSSSSKSDLDEFYHLLYNHYVEDDDNMFRFNYSRAFLRWAVCIPGYKKAWHLGVRVVKSGMLVGCITAIPAQVCINGFLDDGTAAHGTAHGDEDAQAAEAAAAATPVGTVAMVEINFLCVHKKLRTKRLAPVLIKEITRRVNVHNIWQAVFTAGVVIPKPVATNRYWHRSLNPKKLIEVGFSSIRKRMTLARLMKLYKLPAQTRTRGLRAMTENDCDAVHQLLINYLSSAANSFRLYVHFTLEEFKHNFLRKDDIVYSFVVEDEESHRITDFISFYCLPSSILHNPKHTEMRAAYSYYNVCAHTGWETLMYDALILAKNANFDVFNALDVMQNELFLKTLKFGIGDGHLQYYIYNWKCAEIPANKVALVLL